MTGIRCVYRDASPDFPATDQHPDAMRYGPIQTEAGIVFVDAIGDAPTLEDIEAVMNPPQPREPTPLEKLAAAGLTADDLRAVLGLPAHA